MNSPFEEIAFEDLQHIFDEVTEERCKQRKKWGLQFHGLDAWVCILLEEVGEVAKGVNDPKRASKPVLWSIRQELLQVAAVATAMIQQIDTGEPT